MQKPGWPQDQLKDRLFQIKIPEPIRNEGPLLGAVFVEFGETECLTIYNEKNLYFLEMTEKVVVRYSSYNILNISDLVSIIKGYLLVVTRDQKLWLFELKKIERKSELSSLALNQKNPQRAEGKPQKILTVESFLKQSYYHSFFMREVAPNMIELFIASSNNERTDKIIYIYQFTVNQKVGGMGFTLDKNYKMTNHSRQQLYASKNYYDPSINSIIKLKNFSDQAFSVKKIQADFLYVIPVGKTEDFYCLNKNYQLFHPENSSTKVSVKNELKGFLLDNGIQHMNYLLLKSENGQIGLFVVQQSMKIKNLGLKSICYKWHICFNGRLVGVKNESQPVIVTEQLNKKTDRSSTGRLDQNKVEENLSKIHKIGPAENVETKNQENSKQENSKAKSQLNELQIGKKCQKIENQKANSSSSKNQKYEIGNISQRKDHQSSLGVNSEENKKQEPETSKHKSNFKPAKIVSRKDFKKQKVEKVQEQKQSQNLSFVNEKTQQKEAIRKIQECSVEKKAHQQEGPKVNVESNVNQNQFQQIDKKQEVPEQVNLSQVRAQKKDVTTCQKKTKSQENNKNISESSIILKQQKASEDDSQCLKKGGLNTIYQNFVPPVSYEEIFGVKNANSQKQGAPLFFKIKSEKEVSVDSVKKQKETLIMKQNQSKEQINTIKNQKSQFIEKKLEIQNSSKEVEGKLCCDILGLTMDSLNSFVEITGKLQTKSEQIKQELDVFKIGLTKSLEQEMRKGEGMMRISEESCFKATNLMLESSVNEYLGKRLTPKMNEYFKSVMGESRKIYENTMRYYSDKKKQSIISLHNHFQEQEHLVREIKSISADMLASVQNTIAEGEQSHAYLFKEWTNSVKQVNAKLDHNGQVLANHLHDQSASQRQKIIDSLGELRETIQLSNIQQQERQQQQQQRFQGQNDQRTLKAEEQGKKMQQQKKRKDQRFCEESRLKRHKQKKANQQKWTYDPRGIEVSYAYPSPYSYYY